MKTACPFTFFPRSPVQHQLLEARQPLQSVYARDVVVLQEQHAQLGQLAQAEGGEGGDAVARQLKDLQGRKKGKGGKG